MYNTKALELNKVLEAVSLKADILKTKGIICNLEPTNDYEKIKRELEETEEARLHLVRYSTIPLGGVHDVEKTLRKATIGSTLSPDELLDLSLQHNAIQNIIAYFKKLKGDQIKVFYIDEYVSNLELFPDLKKEIDLCITENATVSDNASDTLYKIRKEIKSKEATIKKKLQELLSSKASILTDNLIVSRNNAYCLPVKVEYKNSIKGIIHDESASGTTVYIEPLAIVELANDLLSITNKEKQEIDRILRHLTDRVSEYSDLIQNNFENLLKLDLIYAKAKYAHEFDGYIPLVNEDGIIDIIEGKHPLIDKEKVVPLNLKLGSTYQTIIITGPNTGGKTVALKTVGLLTLMMQVGLLVPAMPGSKLAIFDNVFADIGDEQSIEQSLSTFSSHMTKIIDIINSLSVNSLVLFDELGSGTDPKEGASLAIAILNYLRARGSRTIITSHYSELKAFAYRENDIVNASVEFDLKTLSPTYRLLVGIPGKSNAIEISKRLGLNDTIIEEAILNVNNMDDDISDMMHKLENEGLELEKSRMEYSKEVAKYQELIKKVDEDNQDLDKKRMTFIEKAKEDAKALYEDAKERAELLLLELEDLKNKNDLKEHDIANIKYEINSLDIKKEKVKHIDAELAVGDIVLVIPYNQEGEIIKKNKDRFEVKMGNLSLSMNKSDLNYIGKKKAPIKEVKKTLSKVVKSDTKMELDLRGMRYEEAKYELDNFIDRALLTNYHLVYIIHGFGTGVIRKMVHEYLKSCKNVKSFRYGGEGEGLNGVTVVYFK